jgi:hypothetical protein
MVGSVSQVKQSYFFLNVSKPFQGIIEIGHQAFLFQIGKILGFNNHNKVLVNSLVIVRQLVFVHIPLPGFRTWKYE